MRRKSSIYWKGRRVTLASVLPSICLQENCTQLFLKYPLIHTYTHTHAHTHTHTHTCTCTHPNIYQGSFKNVISNFRLVWMLYALIWIIPLRLNFVCRRFGILCQFHIHRRVGTILHTYPPMKMEQTECSEKLPYSLCMNYWVLVILQYRLKTEHIYTECPTS